MSDNILTCPSSSKDVVSCAIVACNYCTQHAAITASFPTRGKPTIIAVCAIKLEFHVTDNDTDTDADIRDASIV